LDVVLNDSYFLAVTVKNSKLKKSVKHIRALEEKLQNAFKENAKLKVKQKENEKLWKGLESKFSSLRQGAAVLLCGLFAE
jgi:predicted mannosyl-3-phosphoglycerate phosphatase (HAD superfamily)